MVKFMGKERDIFIRSFFYGFFHFILILSIEIQIIVDLFHFQVLKFNLVFFFHFL